MRIDTIDGIDTVVGEGPVWDPTRHVLYFVDLLAGEVREWDPARARSRAWTVGRLTAAVGPTADGALLLAVGEGFARLDPSTGSVSGVVDARCAPGARITDGKVDRTGRFVGVSSDSEFSNPVGGVHRLRHDGTVDGLSRGIVIANGPSWNEQGDRFYVADSRRRVVFEHVYDPLAPELGPGRVFADLGEFDGIPDGATVDADGHLWVVVHGSGLLVRLGLDGRVEERVEFPSKNITSVMFGGEQLDEMWVTSLDPGRIPPHPKADLGVPTDPGSGALYVLRGAGVRGLPEPFAVCDPGVFPPAGGSA